MPCQRFPAGQTSGCRTTCRLQGQQSCRPWRSSRRRHGGAHIAARVDLVTADERRGPRPAAPHSVGYAPTPAAGSVSLATPVQSAHAATITATPEAAAPAQQHMLSSGLDAARPGGGLPLAAYTTSLDNGLLSTLSSSMDSDGEMCTLLSDPSGDVQLLCDSDPAHPISLAESAALRPALPTTLLQDIEAKLEADLSTIAVTILFAVGFISLEFGVNDLIEHYFGDSLLSDVMCVSVGLVVVFWVRISKVRLMRFDRWR